MCTAENASHKCHHSDEEVTASLPEQGVAEAVRAAELEELARPEEERPAVEEERPAPAAVGCPAVDLQPHLQQLQPHLQQLQVL